MIVILYDSRANESRPEAGAFDLRPRSEFLGRPYLARVAEEYRRIGARNVVWAGASGANTNVLVRPTGPCGLTDHRMLTEDMFGRYETAVIADFRLWPDAAMRKAIRQHRKAASTLSTLVDTAPSSTYEEVLERSPSDSGYAVRRSYGTGAALRAERTLALLARPKSLSVVWTHLLGDLATGNLDHLGELASRSQLKLEGKGCLIDSPERYLQRVQQLLVGMGAPSRGAKAIGEGVWAMPGASVAPGCEVRGPVFLGRNCRVSTGSRIVGPTALGESVEVGKGCFVGSSVVLRGARLPRESHVWCSVVGSRAKLEVGQHLSLAWAHQGGVTAYTPEEQEGGFESVVVPSRSALRKWNWRLSSALKRMVDIAGALVGLAVTVPFYPVIALAIKIESHGPVFFAHRRQTRGGKEFGCLKFRSMVDKAHALQSELKNEVDGPQFHIEKDPRLTRVGNFLRKTNLDEVPQFWNVLLGHMSLVGPRPSPDSENQCCPAWREARLSVRAGLTGLWQVERGARSTGDFQEWIHWDTKYANEASLRMDLKVIWKTLLRALRLSRG